jgi:hypothetical protein
MRHTNNTLWRGLDHPHNAPASRLLPPHRRRCRGTSLRPRCRHPATLVYHCHKSPAHAGRHTHDRTDTNSQAHNKLTGIQPPGTRTSTRAVHASVNTHGGGGGKHVQTLTDTVLESTPLHTTSPEMLVQVAGRRMTCWTVWVGGVVSRTNLAKQYKTYPPSQGFCQIVPKSTPPRRMGLRKPHTQSTTPDCNTQTPTAPCSHTRGQATHPLTQSRTPTPPHHWRHHAPQGQRGPGIARRVRRCQLQGEVPLTGPQRQVEAPAEGTRGRHATGALYVRCCQAHSCDTAQEEAH